VNLSLNRYHYNRRRRKEDMRSFDCPIGEETETTLQDVIACPNADTPGEIERAELAENIRLAMEQIEPTKAEVLRFVAVNGRSYEEAAALFKIKVGTVKSRVARARNELRNILAA